MRSWLLGVGVLLIAALIGSFIIVERAVERFEGPGPLDAERVVVIPRGASVEAIAGALADAGVIADAMLFKISVRLLEAGRGLKAGEYSFPAAVSMRGAMELLESGRAVVRNLTVPEGLTSVEIMTLVAQADGLSGVLGSRPAEGSLLPETYHFSLDDGRAEMVARMAAAMSRSLSELWAKSAPGLPLKSPEEALILASIVEKETGVAAERAVVASVFINRLKHGMRLQSDPTVVYGITRGQGPLGRPLTRRDLQSASAYNTYSIDGLPPGPIANPGRAALEAVLHPAQTRYLYFVADGTGGHAFAETLAEHNRNVAKWRKAKRAQTQSAQ